MERRPRIQIQLKPADKIVETLGWLFIVALWCFTIVSYTQLPSIIPVHYDMEGNPNAFGGKATILTMPFLATVVFVLLTVLNKFPHLFNYPTKITQDNALKLYTSATRLIRYLKLIIVFIFGLIVYKTIESANGKADGLGYWFLPLIVILIFIPLIYFLVTSFKTK